jgi:hypothetical protein
MTFRVYLKLLRPVPTLLFGSIFAFGIGSGLVGVFSGASPSETVYITLTLVAPLVFGLILIGPVHEVMHRELCVLLPGVRRELRRWHLTVMATVAALLFLGTEFAGQGVPRAATLGIILAGLALPLINQPASPVGLLIKSALLVACICSLPLAPHARLIATLGTQPWLLLFAGTLCAALCIQHGFSEKNVRERSRARRLVLCLQSFAPLSVADYFELLRYAQNEGVRQSCANMKKLVDSKEWTHGTVGASLRDWVAVLHHSRFGANGGMRKVLLIPLLVSLPCFAFALIMPVLLERQNAQHNFTLTGLCSQFSTACPSGAGHSTAAALVITFGLILGVTLIVALTRSILFEPHRLPIARSRLSQCMFFELLRLSALMTAVVAAEIGILVTATTLLAGQPLSLAHFARPAVVPLLTLPLALFGIAYICRTARTRPLLLGGTMVAFMVASGTPGILLGQAEKHESLWVIRFADAVITPNGLALWLTTTATAVALVWLALRHHFRTCDLSRPLPWLSRTA